MFAFMPYPVFLLALALTQDWVYVSLPRRLHLKLRTEILNGFLATIGLNI